MNESIKHEGKYLTFNLGNEEYGIHITKIKEIIGMMNITEVPQRQDFMKGVINLRGSVIPVVDLRIRFGMVEKEPTDRTCIVQVEVGEADNRHPVGLIVDNVSEVSNISKEHIDEDVALGAVDNNYISGIAKMDGGVKILLDIEQVCHEA